MSAIGITDYGNMMGAFSFLNTIETYNQKILNTCNKPLKGVIGCEFFLSDGSSPLTKNQQDQCWKQVLIAKNKNGYHNLVKLCSEGYINGYSYGFPRVKKELILHYKKDLIALTGDLSAEIPYTILNYGKRRAEELFKWWHDKFEGDFYVELLRHGLEEQNYVNKVLLKLSKKYGVKYIPQNNTFYLEKKDANAHDILLCVRDGRKQGVPIGKNRGYRFGFSNQEYYFKNQNQMVTSFSDIPESFDYLNELMEKISTYSLKREIFLPKFSIPREFQNTLDPEDEGKRGENSYLYHLAFQGAYQHYGLIYPSIKDRLTFELATIEKTKFPGYFLIVQNFVSEARRMGVSVGPGRGSVAGSLVAYCVGITQIDPIQYNLLFERFLNTDRVSLPDIDLDLDDKGRESIVKWVVNKYGNNQVAKIITYTFMAAKSSIRDTARVLDLALEHADNLAKMMPEGVSLKSLLSLNVTQLRKKLYGHDLENGVKLLLIAKDDFLESKVLRQASNLEGLLRCIGVHACGIIISPSDITNYLPIAISKDSELLLTQFDNNVVESAGLLKIDFLGLRTLTIINDTVELVEKIHGIKLIIHEFPLDDLKTYQIFQKGETIAIFQYESIAMQRYLRKLKPDTFEDLIAMNALYRPGPIQYIPNFIARKHGKEPIVYVLPEMKEFLSSTYGITIYQEQVMLLAQKLAGFSKGQADILRKAMGKKQKHILDKIKSKFIYGAVKKGFPKKILEKIWKDWEAFASYAFNKSHSTCYAYLAFQTAYLKTHYTKEYMAAVLSNHIHNIKDISFFMAECRRLGLSVIGPDINESQHFFLVNHQGNIRFGFKAIKGIGEIVVDSIIKERSKNGPYRSVLDFIIRVDSRIINKKSIESLVLSGAFDSFKAIHRAQYFNKERGYNMIEKIIFKKNKTKASLFYDLDFYHVFPYCTHWSNIVQCSKEKQTLGIYISSHPLNDYRLEINAIHGISLEDFNKNEDLWLGKSTIFLYGMIARLERKTSIKKVKKDGVFTLEDDKNIRDFWIFGDAYLKFSHLLTSNTFLAIKVFLDRYKNGVIRINFLQILHLSEVFNLLNKEFLIEIELHKLNHRLIDYIEKTLSKYKGNGTLKIFFLDSKKKICMPSRKYSVHLDKRLFMELEKVQGLYLHLK